MTDTQQEGQKRENRRREPDRESQTNRPREMETNRERHKEILGDGRLAGPNTNTGVEAENITGERGDRRNETLASREGNWFLTPSQT